MPNIGMRGTAPPPIKHLMGWRYRGAQLADAIATQDPAFREKLEAAKARRSEVLKRLRFLQSPRPDLMDKFSEYDGITIARRGVNARLGN